MATEWNEAVEAVQRALRERAMDWERLAEKERDADFQNALMQRARIVRDIAGSVVEQVKRPTEQAAEAVLASGTTGSDPKPRSPLKHQWVGTSVSDSYCARCGRDARDGVTAPCKEIP